MVKKPATTPTTPATTPTPTAPNLQNIPINSELGREIRGAFTATAPAPAPAPAPRVIEIALPEHLSAAPQPDPVPGADYPAVAAEEAGEVLSRMDRPTAQSMEELLDAIDAFDVQISDLSERRATAEAAVAEMLDDHHIRALTWGDYDFGHIHSSNTRLSADLLAQNGIPTWLLAACKVRSGYRYFKFTNLRRAAEKTAQKRAEKDAAKNANGERE